MTSSATCPGCAFFAAGPQWAVDDAVMNHRKRCLDLQQVFDDNRIFIEVAMATPRITVTP